MKILAEIPVKKIKLNDWSFTYEHQTIEVEVVALVRYHATKNKNLNRFHYEAFVKPPPQQLKETIYNAPLFRCNVNRALNKGWKPPAFEEGTMLKVIYND